MTFTIQRDNILFDYSEGYWQIAMAEDLTGHLAGIFQ